MALFRLPTKSSMIYRSEKKRSLDIRAHLRQIGRRSVKINASTASGKEKKNDDTKSRKSEFSRVELRARRKSWGICIARYWLIDFC